jgi:hypothetical protein
MNPRDFLSAAMLGGAAALVGLPDGAMAESPPETTTVRLPEMYDICSGMPYAAQALREIGYTGKWREYDPGEHPSVSFPALPRNWFRQERAAEDHRPRHGLALPQ